MPQVDPRAHVALAHDRKNETTWRLNAAVWAMVRSWPASAMRVVVTEGDDAGGTDESQDDESQDVVESGDREPAA